MKRNKCVVWKKGNLKGKNLGNKNKKEKNSKSARNIMLNVDINHYMLYPGLYAI